MHIYVLILVILMILLGMIWVGLSIIDGLLITYFTYFLLESLYAEANPNGDN